MAKKEIITVETSPVRGGAIKYTGQCLGLIENEKFADIISEIKEAEKFYDQKPEELAKVVEKIKNVDSGKRYRFAMRVERKNGKKVKGKAMYFSCESYFYVNSEAATPNGVSFVCTDGSFNSVTKLDLG